ncbi:MULTISPECIES: hypothetical protein [Psychrobacter]|uniref:hypothetical protein n=1 Tax=Psychrobacter TaxID=497 RepID=UPI000C33374C|nr:hypothetical protein [Psychrobacter sp. Sarcosine-3u-12]PKG36716.1 hypothetical protein CXF65_00950 [Psychrobacter sp. Sarcosine-3u-12]
MTDKNIQLVSTISDDNKLTLSLQNIEMPQPDADEVVVRIEAAPLNPSDFGVMFSAAELNRNFGFAWGVNGFLLFNALAKLGTKTVMSMRKRVAEEITTTFASSYTHEVTLQEALQLQSIAAYGKQATGEKYLIKPQD